MQTQQYTINAGMGSNVDFNNKSPPKKNKWVKNTCEALAMSNTIEDFHTTFVPIPQAIAQLKIIFFISSFVFKKLVQ